MPWRCANRLALGQAVRGRLAGEAAELRKLQREADAAEKRLQTAEKKLAALQGQADSTKPRVLGEAEEAVKDARSMQKIIGDQILRARKRVGDVILEEFAPNRQDVLRTKYL